MKIKTIITIIIVFVCTFSSYSQTDTINKRSENYTPKKGDYIKDLNATNFLGTWEWRDGDNTFKLILSKKKQHFNNLDFSMDLVKSEYSFCKNGQIISASKESIGFSKENKILRINFYDEKFDETGIAILKISDEDISKATWELKNSEGLKVGKYVDEFSVPVNMTLTKKK